MSMNLKNKKTVLTDEAAIYNHNEELSEKEKWQNMPKAKKWQYFKDYYLGKIVAIIVVAAIAGSIVKTMLTPRPDIVLSVAIINDMTYQQTYDELQKQFDEILALDEETQETLFDTGYSIGTGDYQSWQKYTVYSAVGDLDVTILPLSVFEECAAGGMFSPVAGHLPTDLYTALSDYLLETKCRDDDGNLIPDSETVFGISLESSWAFKEQQREEPLVLAINAAAKNGENVEKFLRFLFFPEAVK